MLRKSKMLEIEAEWEEREDEMKREIKIQQREVLYFFFQAEDGIRDIGVTGVQTCALPIYPSINLARIIGGDVINRVPDRATYDLDVRYLPEQDPREITRQIRSIDLPAEAEVLFSHEPTYVSRDSPFVKTLREVAARHFHGNPVGVGRHGASDIVFFQRAGVPGVEFGPVGGGHHGPNEFVVTSSLETYRQMLVQFVRILAAN